MCCFRVLRTVDTEKKQNNLMDTKIKIGGDDIICQLFSEWMYCPVCGNKTRTMIREDTELKNFPLYCPKCKQETIINVQGMKITLADSK